MRKPHFILWLVVGILAVIGIALGAYLYDTQCKACLLDTAFSPDGSYQLRLYAVVEPDWPFGSAYGRITLTEGTKMVSGIEIDLAQDGCQISRENWYVAWRDGYEEITLQASEQADEHWRLHFDGKVERCPELYRKPYQRLP